MGAYSSGSPGSSATPYRASSTGSVSELGSAAVSSDVATEGDGGAVAIEESEDWQDAPVKPNKFEPVYPSDEEWLHEQEDNLYQTMIYETNSVY